MEGLRQAYPQVPVQAVSFEFMDFKDQIRAVRNATIVIGVHGAGLSHILFANSDTTLIELAPLQYAGRMHFEYFAKYAGVDYRKFHIGEAYGDESHIVDVEDLVEFMKNQ